MSRIEKRLQQITDQFDKGINDDEFVVFYPSYGVNPGGGKDCRLEIRGRIFEERRLLRRLPVVALTLVGVPHVRALTEFLGSLADDLEFERIFMKRARNFALDGESNEQFDIELAGSSMQLEFRSDLQGFFTTRVSVPAASLESGMQNEASLWVSYTATDNKRPPFEGRSRVMSRGGVTVVSDIDDTIKDSNVPETKELTINTLFRPFKCTPGLPEIYKAWEERHADFVYLSNSPYQLYEPLVEYLQGEGHYPEGTYYMRLYDAGDVKQSIAKLLAIDDAVGTRENPKKHNLIPILEAFPERKFVLVGDSTEADAEIYVDLFLGKNFPERFAAPVNGYADRIKKIYIRDVENSTKRREAEKALQRIGDRQIARFFNAERPDILEDAIPVFKAAASG